MMNRKDQKRLLDALAATYPAPRSELHFVNDFQLLIAVVLSAQCTDKKVNEVSPLLFERYPTFDALAQAALLEVETILRPINYYRTKARHVIDLARRIIEIFHGVIPDSREGLTSLPGVGRKTANVVLTERGIEEAIAVDTHVFRVARRLGLSEGTTPLHVEHDLMKRFPRDQWRDLHHRLIFHGRRVCRAQRPLCESCPLAGVCAHRKGEGNHSAGVG